MPSYFIERTRRRRLRLGWNWTTWNPVEPEKKSNGRRRYRLHRLAGSRFLTDHNGPANTRRWRAAQAEQWITTERCASLAMRFGVVNQLENDNTFCNEFGREMTIEPKRTISLPPNSLFPNGDEESFPNSGEKTFNRQWHLWAKWPAFESRANSEISEFGPRFDQWRSCVVFVTLLGFPRILQWFPDKNFMVFAWPKCALICRSRQLDYFSQQNLHQNLIN